MSGRFFARISSKFLSKLKNFPRKWKKAFSFQLQKPKILSRPWSSKKLETFLPHKKILKNITGFMSSIGRIQSTVPLTEGEGGCMFTPPLAQLPETTKPPMGGGRGVEGCDARAPTTNNSSHLRPSLIQTPFFWFFAENKLDRLKKKLKVTHVLYFHFFKKFIFSILLQRQHNY